MALSGRRRRRAAAVSTIATTTRFRAVQTSHLATRRQLLLLLLPVLPLRQGRRGRGARRRPEGGRDLVSVPLSASCCSIETRPARRKRRLGGRVSDDHGSYRCVLNVCACVCAPSQSARARGRGKGGRRGVAGVVAWAGGGGEKADDGLGLFFSMLTQGIKKLQRRGVRWRGAEGARKEISWFRFRSGRVRSFCASRAAPRHSSSSSPAFFGYRAASVYAMLATHPLGATYRRSLAAE